MTEEELKAMQKAVRKAKRIATEKAGELHDLVEDRLPGAFEEIPAMAQATYDACKVWSEADAAFKAAETEMS
ncbi:MAG: CCE_0567 family metalloprotein [Candidatus Thiodiazotropha endolucinida]